MSKKENLLNKSGRNQGKKRGQIDQPASYVERVDPDFPTREITGKIISYGHKTDKNPQAIL